MEQSIRFIKDHRGRRIAYAEIGSGPLLLCPAWWVSHLEIDWQHAGFRRFFGALAQDFRVVRYDRLGVGLSDRETVSQSLDEELDTVTRLLEQLRAPSASLLAISCAGPVALRLAAADARIDRLCFFNSYARGSDLATPAVRDAMLSLIAAHWGLGSKTLADIFAPDADGAELEALSRNQREWTTGANAAALMRLAYAMDASHDASRVTASTLVLHRRGDRAIAFEAGQKLAAEMPQAEFVALDSNIHPPWIDGTEDVERVRAFLRNRAVSSTQFSREASIVDEANRELLIDGARIPLTPLEWGVVRALTQRPETVVTRDELLQIVWRQPFAGSNKVDAVIRTLRKKLGAYADSIETATGHGYRFSRWHRSPP